MQCCCRSSLLSTACKAAPSLPRASTSTAAKKTKRHLSTSPSTSAAHSRPYALPKELQQPLPRQTIVPSAPIQPHLHEKHDIGPSSLVSADYLAQLYSVLTPPTRTSLAAFAHRLPHAAFTDAQIKLVELCCICPSFWDAVDDAQPMPTTRQGPYTNYWDDMRASNAELSAQGDAYLRLFAHEYLEARYPHMPQRVVNDALTMYVGSATCADIARLWGVWAGRTSAPELSQRDQKLATGRTAGQGLLRWQRRTDLPNDLSIEVEGVGPFAEAMASVARAIVGAIFQEHGYEATRRFIRANWFSRKADLMPLLKWSRPSMVLMETLIKYNRAPAVSRLLKESGRDSHMPLFVVGIFSENQKLGEGYGSSLKMAEWRAAEDSLRRIYLSRAFSSSSSLPDLHEEPVLPSDTLTLTSPSLPYTPRPLGDDEVEYGRAQSPFPSAREARASPFRPNLAPPHRISHDPPSPLPANLRNPKRPLTGPGSRDPSLPLEHRLPGFYWQQMAGGQPTKRETGWDKPATPIRKKVESGFSGPFEDRKARSTADGKPLPRKVKETLPGI